jgi:two-component system cell cycle response regulator
MLSVGEVIPNWLNKLNNNLVNMKVLVLENSRLYQKTLRDLLEEVGCEVDCVNSGKEGLQLIKDHVFDLIIAGQNIFDDSSSAFIEYCRTHVNHCPILLLTSEPNETLLKNAHNAGIKDIFPKANINLLRENIHYYIKGKKSIFIEGGRVIYIEDSPSVACMITRELKKMNLEVDYYNNAEDAYNAVLKNEYDMVITDVMLQGAMSGLSLVRMIRALKNHHSELPILAMTGHGDPKRRIELFHAGINDYVTKPPVEEEFAARVNNLITNKRLQDKVREQKQALLKLAMKDQLTTCHNRHSLVENAPKYINDSIRYEHPLSVMILDLDYFKIINDEHGHDAGDKVLADIGRMLIRTCRQGDFVSRIGGEEFLIILPHCSAGDAVNKGDLIRSMIESSYPGGLKVTASIGIASLTEEHGAEFDRLYKLADEAVYHSKNNGRNRVTLISNKKKAG